MFDGQYVSPILFRLVPRVCREPMDAQRSEPDGLQGMRVLVVEDEMLLALDLEDGLREVGCDVVGPAGCVGQAMHLARQERVDAAILDVNVAGETVFPVADILAERQVPFLFATAYAGADELYPADVKSVPRLPKPYTISQALRHLKGLVDA